MSAIDQWEHLTKASRHRGLQLARQALVSHGQSIDRSFTTVQEFFSHCGGQLAQMHENLKGLDPISYWPAALADSLKSGMTIGGLLFSTSASLQRDVANALNRQWQMFNDEMIDEVGSYASAVRKIAGRTPHGHGRHHAAPAQQSHA